MDESAQKQHPSSARAGTSDDMDISLLFLQIQPGAIPKNGISQKWMGISKSFFHWIKIGDI